MIYFSVALPVVAIAPVALHFAERRADKTRPVTKISVALVVLAIGVGSIIQIHRIGDAGAQSVWGNEIARLKRATEHSTTFEPAAGEVVREAYGAIDEMGKRLMVEVKCRRLPPRPDRG